MIPNKNQVEPGARALAHLSNLASFTGRVDAAQQFAADAADRAYQDASLQALADNLNNPIVPAPRPSAATAEGETNEYLQQGDVHYGHRGEAMAYKDAVDRDTAKAYKPESDVGYTIE